MTYKAVIADIDGTLVSPNASPETRATKRVVRAVLSAEKKGVIFSLATARSFEWIQGLVTSLSIKAPLILDNGARIYDTRIGKYIFESYLESDLINRALKILGQFPFDINIVDGENRYIYNPKEKLKKEKAVKLMILHLDPADAEQVYRQALKIPQAQITKSVSGENPQRESIHVTSVLAKKDLALARISKYLKIPFKQFIGIGDSYNDLDFLQICGLRVAMGNAVAEVKAIADYIAPSYEDDGVADVIEKYILR